MFGMILGLTISYYTLFVKTGLLHIYVLFTDPRMFN